VTSGKKESSNLKVIKTYLRTSIPQKHLNTVVWQLCSLNPKFAGAQTWTKFWGALLMLKHKNKFIVANAISVL